MGEWSSYGLSDFLMFSPQVYARLVERYNQELWPAQVVAVALGVALLGPARRASGLRAGLLILALAWAWCGWAFHWQRYAQVFLGAPLVAFACWLQAMLLAGAASLRPAAVVVATWQKRAGLLLLAIAALFYWVPAAWATPPWARAEVFGFMPDPTALATVGWLLAAPLGGWLRAVLGIVPLLSLVLGVLTRMALAQ